MSATIVKPVHFPRYGVFKGFTSNFPIMIDSGLFAGLREWRSLSRDLSCE